jgi:hypothetical protein
VPDEQPAFSPDLDLPLIEGAASLAAALSAGVALADLAATLAGPFAREAEMLAAAMDTAILALLSGQNQLGQALQADVLSQARLFRVAPGEAAKRHRRPLRLLGFAAPGDLQTNMPVEFITAHLPAQLLLVYVEPGAPLPSPLPEHDVAICLVSDARLDILRHLSGLLRGWPRPVLNDPAKVLGGHLERLSRQGLARLFAGSPTVLAPEARTLGHAELRAGLASKAGPAALLPGGAWPILARPENSHAGKLLRKLDGPAELAVYLDCVSADPLTLTRFVDYRDADGQYRKRRVALIDGQAHLAHMAISSDWMIHYVNAGMLDDPIKRAEEEAAMADFAGGFAKRHAAALDEIASALGLDYVLIDCAEAPDGRLLLFEIEMAAIIHMLDPVETFPYKPPQMAKIFARFGRMLEEAAGLAVA